MKKLPKFPYINNLRREYHEIYGFTFKDFSSYQVWLKQFGFKVPIRGDYLEFHENITDEDLIAFILRWS